MAGINGLTLGFRATANKRIAKFTALIKATGTQSTEYVDIPGAGNAAGFIGVTVEHFVEPNYFVAQSTAANLVTGTTPATYDLTGKAVTLQVDGVARFIATAAVINAGDWVNIGDAYGRVKTATESAGSKECIGQALNTTGGTVDEIVRVAIRPGLR